MDAQTIGMAIATGAAIGAGAAFKGWMTHGHDEPFNGPKFIRTMMIGAVVGVFAQFMGIPLDAAEQEIHLYLLTLGVLGLASGYLDQFCIWLWQRVKRLKPWRGGPAIEQIAPAAVQTLGSALKDRVDSSTAVSGEIAQPGARNAVYEPTNVSVNIPIKPYP